MVAELLSDPVDNVWPPMWDDMIRRSCLPLRSTARLRMLAGCLVLGVALVGV